MMMLRFNEPIWIKIFHFVIITLNFVITDFHYKFLCHYNSFIYRYLKRHFYNIIYICCHLFLCLLIQYT
ncbi:hypothetical protein HMPREF0662_01731 [Prevotella nigrescens F0103]|nr:hypothetical protein HMPREF0662_01731 [Prevotella nigrescens F0103]